MIFENHKMWQRYLRFAKGKGGRFHISFTIAGELMTLWFKTRPTCVYDDKFDVETGFLRIEYYLRDKFYFCGFYPQYNWRGFEGHKWQAEPAWSRYKLLGETTLGDVEDIMLLLGLTATLKINPDLV